VKQRRPTEKQFASLGGVVLPLRNWYFRDAGRRLRQIAGRSETGAGGPKPQRRSASEAERDNPAGRLTHVLMEHAVLHPR